MQVDVVDFSGGGDVVLGVYVNGRLQNGNVIIQGKPDDWGT